MERHQWYPAFAKYSLATGWALFAGANLTIALGQHYLVDQAVRQTAALLWVVLGLPLVATIRFFYDAVGTVAKQYRVSDDKLMADLAQRLLRRSDGAVRIGVYPSPIANAFAISSVFGKKSLIAFSTALVEIANDRQLTSIAAHEIAHLRYGDSKNKTLILAFNQAIRTYPWLVSKISHDLVRVGVVIAVIVGILVYMLISIGQQSPASLASVQGWFLMWAKIIIWPILFIVGYFGLNYALNRAFSAYSREREYAADAGGAAMTSKEDMADALSLFTHEHGTEIDVFDSHPPIAERIRRLSVDISRSRS